MVLLVERAPVAPMNEHHAAAVALARRENVHGLPGRIAVAQVEVAGHGRAGVPGVARPALEVALVIRDQRILSPAEADPVAPGDYIYLLAPPEKAESLDRFFVDMQPSSAPDPHQLGDFTVSGDHTLGELAEIYGVAVDEEQAKLTLADYFDIHLDRAPKEGAELPLDSIVLVARSIGGGRVDVVGLRLPEDEEDFAPETRAAVLKRRLSRMWKSVAGI